MRRIYLDYAATAPLLPEARDAMEEALSPTAFGNPSSLYQEGRQARTVIDRSREVLASAVACAFGEFLFTSSGTEAANLAIIGCALANKDRTRDKVLFGAVEHPCVGKTQGILSRLGFSVEGVPVSPDGVLDLEALRRMIGPRVLLVSVMHANNEVGAVQPVREVAQLCSSNDAIFHCDAVQTFGALPWTVKDLGADLISVSAHKIGGPMGAGGLYVRAGTPIAPMLVGGGQEREIRAGTENVAAIAGFAAAAKAVVGDQDRATRMREAREAFLSALGKNIEYRVNGRPDLPGHVNLSIAGASAESMLVVLDRMGLSASSGSACSSGSIEPSHVLLAMGVSTEAAKQSLRFTFGPDTGEATARQAAEIVSEAARQVRGRG